MRPIDADAAIKAVHDEFDECLVWDESGEHTADVIAEIIEALPTAEPTYEQVKDYCHKRCLSIVDNALLQKYAFAAEPQIIRCEHCEHHEDDDCPEPHWCFVWETFTDNHVYCSFAERREDEAGKR